MHRARLIRVARNRVAALTGATVLAVLAVTFLHDPGTSNRTAPTDLAGGMTAVAQYSPGATNAVTASDYFLKIEGIPGEATDKAHAGQIELQSFSWGATSSGTATAGGAGAGKVNFSDFSFSKFQDKASPLLLQFLASGKRIPEATLYGVSSGKGRVDYMTITMSGVLISSFQSAGSSGGAQMDSVSINFAKIQYEYRPQGADGTFGPAVRSGWDLAANKKIRRPPSMRASGPHVRPAPDVDRPPVIDRPVSAARNSTALGVSSGVLGCPRV